MCCVEKINNLSFFQEVRREGKNKRDERRGTKGNGREIRKRTRQEELLQLIKNLLSVLLPAESLL